MLMAGFIEDSKPEDALYGIVLRSTDYCGRIEDLIVPKVPKDITVLSYDDIPGPNYVQITGENLPILTEKKISYLGEPILLLAGPDLVQLNNFADQIKINVAPETPALPEDLVKDFIYEKSFVQGSSGRKFGKAFQVIEGEYLTPWQEHHISDADGALAIPGKNEMEIICPSQWIFHVRDSIAETCKIQKQKINVTQSLMSSPYDGRLWYPSLHAVYAALLSQKTGKPVFLSITREENLIFSPKRTPVTCKIKSAVNQEGNLVALEAEALVNAGAYALMADELAFRLACGIKGIYKCDHFSIYIKCYKTNLPPFGAFRGMAGTQGFFASELHTTRLAELSQGDPAVWKKSNLANIPLKKSPAHIIQSLIDTVGNKADFSRKHSAYEIQNKTRKNLENSPLAPRGIGISCAYQLNGFCAVEEDIASVRMTLDTENSLTIQTSIRPTDSWVKTQWIETAAEILSIEKKSIHLECGNTDKSLDTGPDIFSRNVSVVLRLIKRCAGAILKQRFRAPLPLSVKRSLTSRMDASASLQNLMDDKSSDISWGACVLELEMNLFSLIPSIKGIWLAIATEIIGNKKLAASSIEAAVLQSLQWCSKNIFMPFHSEDFLHHYHLPKVNSIPSIHITFLEDKQRQPIGISDIADILVPPAYLSAISQATGYYFDRLPVTPLQIADSMEVVEEQ